MITYPQSIFDQGNQLLGLLGSFWSQTYSGRDQLQAFATGFGQLANEANAALGVTLDCLSVDTVPVYRYNAWRALTVLQSQLEAVAPLLYDGNHQFDTGLLFDANSGPPAYTVSAGDVAYVEWIFDRLITPAVSLCAGLDFLLSNGQLTFLADPFSNPAFQQAPVYDASGAIVDWELTLWLYHPGRDSQFIYNHFGYVLGLQLPASPGYKQLVQALWDGAVLGASGRVLDHVVSAVTGVPLANGSDTVQVVGIDRHGLAVISDQFVYRLPKNSNPLVAVGDLLEEGQALCDAVQIASFNSGKIPAGLQMLAIGPGVLAPEYDGDLVFVNKTVPLVVTFDGAGNTKVTFEISGFTQDVTKFWNTVHANGVAAGQTFANLLDVRPNPIGQPTAASLPATINPLGFLIANFLRSNCFLVTINVGSLSSRRLGLQSLQLLRRIIPPHTMMFVLLQMPALSDGVGTAAKPAEVLTSYTGLTPLGDLTLVQSDNRPPVLRNLSGCG